MSIDRQGSAPHGPPGLSRYQPEFSTPERRISSTTTFVVALAFARRTVLRLLPWLRSRQRFLRWAQRKFWTHSFPDPRFGHDDGQRREAGRKPALNIWGRSP